jgi:5-methyltetrahydrofolate--homocysteine methyltransferase
LDAVLELGIVWKYPAILTDEVIGEQATSVLRMHNDAERYFDREEINCQRYLRHFSSESNHDDDIEPTDGKRKITIIFDLRQQSQNQRCT